MLHALPTHTNIILCQNVLDSDEAHGKVTTTKGKKQATLKTRKSIGFGKPKKKKGSDDDDDFSDFDAPKARKTAASGPPKPRALKITTEPAKKETDAAHEKPKPGMKPTASSFSDDDAPVVQRRRTKATIPADTIDLKGKGKNDVSTKRKR